MALARVPGQAAGTQALEDPPEPPADPFARVAPLPVELDVRVPVHDFRVKDLIRLAPGALIESGWYHGDDLPLASGHVQLAWTEFEVVDTQLAVRLTRLP